MSIAARGRANKAKAEIDHAIERLNDLRDQQRSAQPNQAWVKAMIRQITQP
jgi:hypothetical protein